MDLLNRVSDTGRNLRLLPIDAEKINNVRAGKHTSQFYTPATSSDSFLINYLFFANLFAGEYDLLHREGDYPILRPTHNFSTKALTIEAQLTFPQRLHSESKDGLASSSFEPDYGNWNLEASANPVLFCSLDLDQEIVPARIYFRGRKPLVESMGNGTDEVRHLFKGKLYDTKFVLKEESFRLTKYDPVSDLCIEEVTRE